MMGHRAPMVCVWRMGKAGQQPEQNIFCPAGWLQPAGPVAQGGQSLRSHPRVSPFSCAGGEQTCLHDHQPWGPSTPGRAIAWANTTQALKLLWCNYLPWPLRMDWFLSKFLLLPTVVVYMCTIFLLWAVIRDHLHIPQAQEHKNSPDTVRDSCRVYPEGGPWLGPLVGTFRQ